MNHKPTKKTENWLSLFVKHHSRALSIIGALIVFITFVVKDAVRDHVKEIVDSLQSAEGVFLIRADTASVAYAMSGISERVDQIWDATPDRAEYIKTNDSSRIEAFSDLQKYSQGIELLKVNLDRVSRLVHSVPKSKGSDVRTNELETFVNRFRKVNQDEKILDTKLQSDPAIGFEEAAEEFSTLGNDYEDLGIDLDDFSERILKEFEEVKESEERFYNVCTWVSYFLYAIGWGMTFAGKLFNVEISGSAE